MHEPLKYRQEINRKLIHLASSSIPFMLWYFGKDSFQPWIIAVAIILPILDYGRRHNKFLYRIYSKLFTGFTRPIEQGILSGASWVIIGAAITIFIFNENSAIIGLLVLSIADSAAAIIGIKFGKTRFLSKSLEGSAAFFITASIIVFTISPAAFYINISAVIAATVVELFATPRINDNLLIPMVTAFILSLGGIG
jgi:dolichol kinase